MQARGEDIDMISNPSQAEMVQRQFKERKRELEESKRRAILEKYGSVGSAPPPGAAGAEGSGSAAAAAAAAATGGATGFIGTVLDPRLRLGQTEAYVEYSADGRVIRSAAMAAPRSKYQEDVLEQNHTAVWGSFFSRAKRSWGYACCHSLVRGAYCTGELGRRAEEAEAEHEREALLALQARQRETELAASAAAGGGGGRSAGGGFKRGDVYGDADSKVVLDETKMKEALRKAAEWQQNGGASGAAAAAAAAGSDGTVAGNKRGYNSLQATADMTPEDMEAWRIKRQKEEDPMLALLGSEELLEYKK
jgi:pre-mRNA-processing factor SLU7